MPTALRRLLAVFLLLGGFTALAPTIADSASATAHVVTLRVDGPIGPATSDYITRGLAIAAERNASLVVLEMDTPGGLDSAMRVIIKHILASPIPVASYVTPEGARAASAGTFILYASHIAAMAPATNLGAATPVTIAASENAPASSAEGEDSDKADAGDAKSTSSGSPMMNKVTNDAAAYLRSLAQLRARDTGFAERAVREGASLSADEALQAGVIDLVATSRADLLAQLDGRVIKLDTGSHVTLALASADLSHITPDWRYQVLAVLSNPQIALVLMMIGIYGLFFEFTSPGFGVPGVAGLICVLIAMYAFQLLPVNWAGVALIVVGAALMLAEAFAPSFGVLGVGGIIAFLVGGMFLFDGEIPGLTLPPSFLIGLALLSTALLLTIGTFAAKARKRRVVSGREEMLGVTGTVTSTTSDGCYASLHGESWRVSTDSKLTPGDRIRVTAMDGLTLKVEPFTDETSDLHKE
jgi:membrane-bound serine protease (ClpP class)